jgi:phage/plasmid-associated DNA primase
MLTIADHITNYVTNKTEQAILNNFISDTTKGIKVPKLIVLYGTGKNGKSTFLNHLEAHFGQGATVLPLGTVGRKKSVYNSPSLYFVKGKNLVILKELGANEKLDQGIIKSLLYDNTFIGRLLYKNPELIENNANYIICTNRLDILDNLSKDDFIIITFNKTF